MYQLCCSPLSQYSPLSAFRIAEQSKYFVSETKISLKLVPWIISVLRVCCSVARWERTTCWSDSTEATKSFTYTYSCQCLCASLCGNGQWRIAVVVWFDVIKWRLDETELLYKWKRANSFCQFDSLHNERKWNLILSKSVEFLDFFFYFICMGARTVKPFVRFVQLIRKEMNSFYSVNCLLISFSMSRKTLQRLWQCVTLVFARKCQFSFNKYS